MSAQVVKVIPKDGTSYSIDENGASGIVLRYQVVLSEPLPQSQLLKSFSAGGVAIPAIGSEHPDRPGHYVAGYDVRQPGGAAKKTLDVTVKYTPRNYTTESGGSDEEGQPIEFGSNIESWGWDDGTTSRELVDDALDKPVRNSAGDQFDSVPQVEYPSPTFQKIVRFEKRINGWFDFNCTVNADPVVIGGVSFPPFTLLCTVSETLEPTHVKWPYRYSVRLRYRTNRARVNGSSEQTECGWDVAITDAGMREIGDDGKLKFIETISKETRRPVAVTSPELLNGNGKAVTRGSEASTVPTYNLRFQTYKSMKFPDWFTSEPLLARDILHPEKEK